MVNLYADKALKEATWKITFTNNSEKNVCESLVGLPGTEVLGVAESTGICNGRVQQKILNVFEEKHNEGSAEMDKKISSIAQNAMTEKQLIGIMVAEQVKEILKRVDEHKSTSDMTSKISRITANCSNKNTFNLLLMQLNENVTTQHGAETKDQNDMEGSSVPEPTHLNLNLTFDGCEGVNVRECVKIVVTTKTSKQSVLLNSNRELTLPVRISGENVGSDVLPYLNVHIAFPNKKHAAGINQMITLDPTKDRKRDMPVPKTKKLAAVSKLTRTKIPEFSPIHKRIFEKIESVVDYVDRKTEPSKFLKSNIEKKIRSTGANATSREVKNRKPSIKAANISNRLATTATKPYSTLPQYTLPNTVFKDIKLLNSKLKTVNSDLLVTTKSAKVKGRLQVMKLNKFDTISDCKTSYLKRVMKLEKSIEYRSKALKKTTNKPFLQAPPSSVTSIPVNADNPLNGVDAGDA